MAGDGARRLREFLAARDVPCHACRYNLRGVEEPRCPECGVVIPSPSIIPAEDASLVSLNRQTMGALRGLAFLGGALAILHVMRLILAWGSMSTVGVASTVGLILGVMPLVAIAAWMHGRERLAAMTPPSRVVRAWASAIVSLVSVAGSCLAASVR